MIREFRKYDVKYYIFASTLSGAKEELERCLNGYYVDTDAEKLIQEDDAANPGNGQEPRVRSGSRGCAGVWEPQRQQYSLSSICS